MIAELNVERRPLVELKPHPENPRTHDEEGGERWKALKKSLEHDYFDPLVFNLRNGFLVSGHFRRKVLESMGVTEVDVVVVDYEEETHLARMLAANRQFGEWDEEALNDLNEALQSSGVEGWLAGVLDSEWSDFGGGQIDVEDDSDEVVDKLGRSDELQAKWQVQAGELFEAGGLRLLCGDCTEERSWKLLLGQEKADLLWTDPPYNVAYDSLQEHRNEALGQHGAVQALEGDDLSDADYRDLLNRAFASAFLSMKKGGCIYVAHADSQRLPNQLALEEAGFMAKQTLIWVKPQFTLGRQDYQWRHEPILYGWKSGAAHYWNGGFSQSTVVEMETGDSVGIGHPTVKPLDLVVQHITSSSRKGELVMDLFAGSGTTLLAAYHAGRRAVATELEPKFCAVILERLEEAGLEIKRYEPEADA